MHDTSAHGNAFFKCDFCRKPWAEDRPMVEGHHGSLICSACLTVAYAEIAKATDATTDAGREQRLAGLDGGPTCTMCLEVREEAHWQSPLYPDARVCRRCVKQSAGVLEHDEDHAWKRP